MILVPHFQQDTTYTCGPTVLQMVFAFYGIDKTEKELMELLETNKDEGTGHGAMIKVARDLGFDIYVNEESTLSELKNFIEENKPVIVNFIEPDNDDGHYAVVIGIDDDKVTLNDPWHGEGFEMEINDFANRWHSETDNAKNWLLVLERK